jgi:hypothetical protein
MSNFVLQRLSSGSAAVRSRSHSWRTPHEVGSATPQTFGRTRARRIS